MYRPLPSSHWLLDTPIAHRGLHRGHGVPENSLGAFREAVDMGCAIEMDVQLLADGNIAVFHDSDLWRVAGCNVRLGAQTAATLSQFRLFGSSETVPLLAEVLDLVNGSVPLLIEVKSFTPKVGLFEQALLAQLQHYRGEFALQSFNPLTIFYLKRHAPHILRGQLSGVSEEVSLPSTVEWILRNCPPYWLTKPHFVSHSLHGLPHWSTDRFRASGKPVLAWTIKTPEQLEAAQRLADNCIFERWD